MLAAEEDMTTYQLVPFTSTTQVNSALHPSKSLNRVPASAGVKAQSHRFQVAGNTVWCGDFDYELLYPMYRTLLHHSSRR